MPSGEKATDAGQGVAFQLQYAVRPSGPEGPVLWIEDTGRWHADGGARPARVEGVVRVVNERHAREERLAFLSRYDEDTGLFNRSYLLDLLEDAISQSLKLRTPAAFLVVAIDNLKLINEAYGINAADRVIVAVAQRIRGRLRDGDAIGRFAPDKIGILLQHCEEHEMTVAAERFISAVGDDVVTTPDSVIAATPIGFDGEPPAITSGIFGLSRFTSAGGAHAGSRYLPSMCAVPVHCLPALPTPTG